MVLNKRELAKAISPGPGHSRMVNRKRLSGGHRPLLRPKPTAGVGVANAATSKMRVVVRIRPQSERELENNSRNIVKTIDDSNLVFDPKEDAQPFFYHGVKQKRRDMLKKENKAMDFGFDKVFGQDASNDDVFEGSSKDLIASLLDGYNCSVFVYGATGSGKTYTMLGGPNSPGIAYLTMVELYRQMALLHDERGFELWVSYLEVYNENVHNLLNPEKVLHLRDDGNSGIVVAGLEQQVIHSAEELLALLNSGNKNRTQHPTDSNAESSRSHAVFQVYIRMRSKLGREVKQVKLSMIDLAGSERGAATGCKGARFTEGANINRSLLALGNCINSLADGLKHIPYRDSKLTRLLKDSLGGNCSTVMIANVSPAPASFEDTYNTLKYASRAKAIRSKIKRNIVTVDLHLAQYVAMIDKLKLELAQANAVIQEYKDRGVPAEAMSDKSVLSAEDAARVEQWREQIRGCFAEKTKLHREIMWLERRLISVKYRRDLKAVTGKRLLKLNPMDRSALDKALGRVYSSLGQFKGQISVFEQQNAQNWQREQKNNQNLDAVLTRVKESGLESHLQSDIDAYKLELKDAETDMELRHLQQLAVTQQSQLQGQEAVIAEMAETLTGYHTLLQALHKTTQPMERQFKKLRRKLEGVKIVSWGKVHQSSLEEPEEEDTPLQIPPRIADFMSLSFTKVGPQSSENNISQLDYSKEEKALSSPNLVDDFASLDDYIRHMTRSLRSVTTVPNLEVDLLTVYNAGDPQLLVDPYGVDLNQTVVMEDGRLNSTLVLNGDVMTPCEPKSRLPNMNETFVSDSQLSSLAMPSAFSVESLNDTLEIDDAARQRSHASQGLLNAGESLIARPSKFHASDLNGTFVLNEREETEEVLDNRKRIVHKANLKRAASMKSALVSSAEKKCNKENGYQAKGMMSAIDFAKPCPQVPRAPRLIVSGGLGKRDDRTVARTPLRPNMHPGGFKKPNIPFSAKDGRTVSRLKERSAVAQVHQYVRPLNRNGISLQMPDTPTIKKIV